jgi:cysteine-rich repeat protein
LTEAIVESDSFGISCQYGRTSGGGGNKLSVDHLQVNVHYSPAGICGDSSVDAGEDCDDGNMADGDCCSSTCAFEATGSNCDEQDACTTSDTCDGAGTCNPGAPLVCDNGLFCDGVEICDSVAGCQVGTPPTSDDGVACTDDSCDEAGDVIVNSPNQSLCDNGLFCDGSETCDPLLDCQSPGSVDCDDHDECTADSCDAIAGCVHDPVYGCDPTLIPTLSSGIRVLLWLFMSGLGGLAVSRRHRSVGN